MWAMTSALASGVCAAALAAVVLAVSARRGPRAGANLVATRPLSLPDLPVWMRLLWPGAQTVVPLVARLAPPRLCHPITRALSQAGLAGVPVPHWLALRLVSAVGLAAAVAHVVAVIAALAVWLLGAAWAMAWVTASWAGVIAAMIAATLAGLLWPSLWLHERRHARRTRMARDLPFVLDVTTLCVEAGASLSGALAHAATRGPAGPLRDELALALAEIRAGTPRRAALRAMADRVALPGLRAVVAALAQADALGMAVAPVLRAQADALRSQRFLHAEQRAQQAPVKMLLPLALCIFPCTFLVIGFPVVVRLLAYG